MCAGVQPGEASAEDLNLEFAGFEEFLVHGGYFEFSARGRLNMFGHIYHFVGVEIKAYHSIVALGLLRLLLDAQAIALLVKFGHAIALGVADPVAKDGGFIILFGILNGLFEKAGETVAVENVISEDQASAVIANKLFTNDKSLGKAIRTWLFGILKVHAVVRSVAKQPPEPGEVVGGADDEDIADPGQHQGTDGVIDHRLVINGEQLLAHSLCDWI